MAPRKKKADLDVKSPMKKKPRSPRKKIEKKEKKPDRHTKERPRRTRKTRTKAAKVPTVSEEPTLYGELFWEYRAKTAEWEKAFLDSCMASKVVKDMSQDPKYKPLLDVLRSEEQARTELKQRAGILKAVQERVAERLNIGLDYFLKNCLIDFDTGVVSFLEE